MSFVDDIIQKVKDYGQQYSEEYIAEVKNYIVRYNQFEYDILKIKNKISKGGYSEDIINKFLKIQANQKVLDEQVNKFMALTNMGDKFKDYEISIDYLKSKLGDIQEVTAVLYMFLTQTKPLIDEQEKDIADIQKLMEGANPTLLNILIKR